MDKIVGFVTITRKCDGKEGKAVAYTKDGSWFDYAVVLETPIFDSNMNYGDVWVADEIYDDDEVRKANDFEVVLFKIRTRDGDYACSYSHKEYIDSHVVKIDLIFKDGFNELRDPTRVVPVETAKKACKMAVKDLAEKLLEMSDMNLAADMLGRIRDEKI